MNVLGRVAKGVGGVVFGDARAALTVTHSDESEVEALLQRVSEAHQPDYRREAIVQLKDLLVDNPKAQLALGSMGLPILISVLQDDRDDVELLRGALEVLVHAMHCDAPGAGADVQQHAEAQAGAINAELYSRRGESVALLLTLLEDEPVGVNDFYVRYYTVQLLTALLTHCSFKLQEAILASPMGVVRLMDMLMEREVIRNEALVLLVALTRSNGEVQKIAAFEGAFDRCFNIVREEGGATGGVVVQDSLELVNNLVRGNLANQRLFREMGHCGQVPMLLLSAAPSPAPVPAPAGTAANGGSMRGPEPVPRQQAAILLCALETLTLLVGAPTSAGEEARAAEAANRTANQAKLLGAGALEALLPLALQDGGLASVPVRIQAVRCLGELVAGSRADQDKLAAMTVSLLGAHTPVLQAALRMALYGAEARERSAAEHLLRCFCLANSDGQIMLAATLAPLGGGGAVEEPPETFGAELVVALVGNASGGGTASAALTTSGRAAGVLQLLLCDNAQAKLRVLTMPLVMATAVAQPEHLMPRVMRHLLDAAQGVGESGRLAAALLLRLLVVWLHGCPQAVAALVDGAAHLPLLVDIVTGRLGGGDTGVTGLAAALLCVCLLHSSTESTDAGSSSSSQASTSAPTPLGSHHRRTSSSHQQAPPLQHGRSRAAGVLDVLVHRVGLSVLFGRLDDLRRSPGFLAASSAPGLPKPVTRAAAAAATAEDGADGGSAAGLGSLRDATRSRHVLQPGQASGGALRDGGGTASGAGDLFDSRLVALVLQVECDAQQRTMAAFAQPAGQSSQGGADPLALLLSLDPSADDAARLEAAMEALRRLAAELQDARARNRALAEDMFRSSAEGKSASTGGLESAAAGSGASLGGHGGVGGPAGTGGLTSTSTGGGGGSSAADVEARVAAELRATRDEALLASLRQQLLAVQSRLSAMEHELADAREEAAAGAGAASKAESDLRDLSAAYNTLEEHAFRQEATLREAQAKVAAGAHTAAAPSGLSGVSEAEVQRRIDAAVSSSLAHADIQTQRREAELAAAAAAAAATASAAFAAATAAAHSAMAADPEDVAARVAAAAAAARSEAEGESEEQLTDLLVCLGQEEQKVALLRAKLEEMGVDPEPLLAGVGQDDEEEEGDGGQD